jgi:hypothetical protein
VAERHVELRLRLLMAGDAQLRLAHLQHLGRSRT